MRLWTLLLLGAAYVVCACSTYTKVEEKRRAANPIVDFQESHEKLQTSDQKAWLQGRRNYLKSLYQEKIDPYFGRADQGANCELKSVFPVAETSNASVSYSEFRVLTNQLGATGVCDERMQTHSMVLVFGACKSRAAQFTLKVVCPRESIDRSTCRVSQDQIERYCVSGRHDFLKSDNSS